MTLEPSCAEEGGICNCECQFAIKVTKRIMPAGRSKSKTVSRSECRLAPVCVAEVNGREVVRAGGRAQIIPQDRVDWFWEIAFRSSPLTGVCAWAALCWGNECAAPFGWVARNEQ